MESGRSLGDILRTLYEWAGIDLLSSPSMR